MHRLARKLVILLGLALIAVACGGGGGDNKGAQSEGGKKAPVIVGAIFDLSGVTSDVGTPYAQGIQDSVKFINQGGGIDGHPIDFRFSDYGYKVPNAEQFYSQYVSEGAVAFMGWGTADTEALRSRVTADQIPYMSASYAETLANPKETPYNFFPGISYSQQMRVVLKWIAEQEKGNKVKVAVFHHDSAFGTSPLEDGRKYIEEKDLKIDFVPVKMPAGVTDYVPQLQNEAKGAKYIVIQNIPTPGAKLAQNVASAKLDAKVICMNWCGDELFARQAGPAAEGTIHVMPFAPPDAGAEGLKDLIEYVKGQGTTLEAKGIRYVQGWFTVASMAEGIKNALADKGGGAITGPDVKAGLEKVKDFSTGGVSDPINYSPESHAGLKTTPLYVIKGGKFEKLTDPITP